jgi:hypothetical protein
MTTAVALGPGVHDIPAAAYHADPVEGGSLSSSGARRILESPAKFRYEQDHPPASRDVFDFGHAAHKLVLGIGPELVVVDATDWRTKAAQQARDEARGAGYVPILMADWHRVEAMSNAIREHPLARVLFADVTAHEQVLVWRDEETGVMRRAMLDCRRGRVVVDYKTSTCAAPDAFAKSVAAYGYHQQDAYYRDGVTALGLDDDPAFLFVVQEKDPPYLVAVYDLDDEALRIGRERNRLALQRYRDCVESGLWPGYSADIETIALPRWAERQHEETYG